MINGRNQELLDQINMIREKGNFQTLITKIGANKLKKFISSMYPEQSIPEIEKITGIPDSTLERWFVQLGLPKSRRHFTNASIPGNFDAEIVLTGVKTAQKFSVINITPELAYLVGFVLGDGSIQKFMVEAFNKDRKLREHLLEIMKPYGSVTETERDDGLWKLRLSSVKLTNLIKDEKGIRQDTLDYIFEDAELAKKFIAAFWDAEGSIGKRKNLKNYFDVILYNTNTNILSQIRSFLKDNDIDTSLKHFTETRGSYFIGGRKVSAKKKVFRIRVLQGSFENWINLVGVRMLHSKKSAVVNEMLKKFVREGI